jgi:hypothetical protein
MVLQAAAAPEYAVVTLPEKALDALCLCWGGATIPAPDASSGVLPPSSSDSMKVR